MSYFCCYNSLLSAFLVRRMAPFRVLSVFCIGSYRLRALPSLMMMFEVFFVTLSFFIQLYYKSPLRRNQSGKMVASCEQTITAELPKQNGQGIQQPNIRGFGSQLRLRLKL